MVSPFSRLPLMTGLRPSLLGLVGVIVVWVVAPHLAQADEVTEAEVRRWVARLDADRKSERQKAVEELIRLGPAVLKWLPEPQALGTRSAAEAVKSIRVRLERIKAEAAVEATQLRLGRSASLETVLARVVPETGNDVAFDSLSEAVRQTRLDWPERPTFWDIIEELTRRSPTTWQLETNPPRLRLFPIKPAASASDPGKSDPQSHAALAVTQSHAFRVALRSIQFRDVVGAEPGRLARIELDVAAEPRLRPLFVTCAATDMQVRSKSTEQADLVWPPFEPDTKLELSFGQGRRQLSWPLDFRVPAGANTSKLLVSGEMRVLTAAGEESLDFPAGAAARGVSLRRGGVKVTVTNWETADSADGPTVTVEALVVYDASGIAFESHRTWMLSNVAGLAKVNAAEKRFGPQVTGLIRPVHGEVESQPDGAIRVRYRFEELPVPVNQIQFRYVAPTLLLDVPVTFRFPEVSVGK